MNEWFDSLSPMTKALLQGQWISVLIAGTGIFATILSDTHPSSNFPLLMNSCNYLLLSTYLIRRHILHSPNGERCSADSKSGDSIHNDLNVSAHSIEPHDIAAATISLPGSSNKSIMYWYIFAAILDVEANYLVLLAYNYTTITSVMLLDCFTIPCAMVLSYLFLGCRYNYKHLIGTGICLLGLACIVINDATRATDDDAPTGSNPVLGDILCLCGAVLYASSNVLQEHLVKFHDREEFLGHLGAFGVVIAVVQCMIVDLPRIRRANFTGKVIGAMAGFVVCLFLMYTNTTAFLQHGDAVLFNLSLLTSDVYAVVFTYFFSGYLVSWLYFLAFALVIVGLVLYHSQPRPLLIGRDNGELGLFVSMQRSVLGTCCPTCASGSGGGSSAGAGGGGGGDSGGEDWRAPYGRSRSGSSGRGGSSVDRSGSGSSGSAGDRRALQYNPLALRPPEECP